MEIFMIVFILSLWFILLVIFQLVFALFEVIFKFGDLGFKQFVTF
jgi:hypothetical protein